MDRLSTPGDYTSRSRLCPVPCRQREDLELRNIKQCFQVRKILYDQNLRSKQQPMDCKGRSVRTGGIQPEHVHSSLYKGFGKPGCD